MGAELAACGAVAVAAFVSWTGTHGPQVGGHPARDQRGGQVDEPGRQALSEQAGNDWLFRQMDLGYCTCSRRDRLEADRHLDSASGLGGDRHRGDIEPYAGGAKTGEARFVLPHGAVGLAWVFFESSSRVSLLLEHDFFRNPGLSFRDHALALTFPLRDAASGLAMPRPAMEHSSERVDSA